MINYKDFYFSLEHVTKKVIIKLADADLTASKVADYMLFFGKKLDTYDHNVV
jgi:hypothetical protein